MDAVLRWADLVREVAVEYDLSSALVLAVIWVESRGNPEAVNQRSQATGLMQVMPREAGKVFADRPGRDELLDPKVNIDWGCRILRYFWNREENLIEALYRYSGGQVWGNHNDFMRRYLLPVIQAWTEIGELLEMGISDG